MNKLRYFVASVSVLALTPMLAFAQFGSTGGDGKITDFLQDLISFINDVLIPLVFAIALFVFMWGVFKYFILGGGESEKQEEGRQLMLYAIIGFVIMVSIFGIVNLIAGGLGFSDNQEIQNIPNVPTNNP